MTETGTKDKEVKNPKGADWEKEFMNTNVELHKTSTELDDLKRKISELHTEYYKLWKSAVNIYSSKVKLLAKISNDIRSLLCD